MQPAISSSRLEPARSRAGVDGGGAGRNLQATNMSINCKTTVCGDSKKDLGVGGTYEDERHDEGEQQVDEHKLDGLVASRGA